MRKKFGENLKNSALSRVASVPSVILLSIKR